MVLSGVQFVVECKDIEEQGDVEQRCLGRWLITLFVKSATLFGGYVSLERLTEFHRSSPEGMLDNEEQGMDNPPNI